MPEIYEINCYCTILQKSNITTLLNYPCTCIMLTQAADVLSQIEEEILYYATTYLYDV